MKPTPDGHYLHSDVARNTQVFDPDYGDEDCEPGLPAQPFWRTFLGVLTVVFVVTMTVIAMLVIFAVPVFAQPNGMGWPLDVEERGDPT